VLQTISPTWTRFPPEYLDSFDDQSFIGRELDFAKLILMMSTAITTWDRWGFDE
jgi:hypothetical protein